MTQIKVGNVKVNPVWQPQPGPQSDFLSSSANTIGYGGSFGGGKSEALIAFPYRYAHYDDYKVLFLRRTYKQISDILERCKRLYPKLGWKPEEGGMKWRAPSGAFLEFGHIQHPGDEDNYLSKEYNTILFDQAEQFTEKMIRRVSARCRTTNPDIIPQVVMSFNPGGPAHLWCKNNFVDRCPVENRGEKRYNEKFDIWWQPKRCAGAFIDEFGMSWEFHPSLVFDNPKLADNDPIYVKRLLALPEDEREAYLWGNFEMFAGQYFREWNRQIHIVPMNKLQRIPNTWDIYGYNDYATTGWYYQGALAINHNAEVIVIEEDYFLGGSIRKKAHRADMLIGKYPRMIKWAAPWDMFNEIRDRETERVTGTIMDLFKRQMERKIKFVKAPRDRIGGWELIKDGLTWSDNEKPWLYIRENCTKLIETIGTLTYDENDNRDLDKEGWTHGVDALRYGLQVSKRKKKDIPIDAYDQIPKKIMSKTKHWLLR